MSIVARHWLGAERSLPLGFAIGGDVRGREGVGTGGERDQHDKHMSQPFLLVSVWWVGAGHAGREEADCLRLKGGALWRGFLLGARSGSCSSGFAGAAHRRHRGLLGRTYMPLGDLGSITSMIGRP